MRETTIAERYAIALLEIGAEKKNLEAMGQELDRVVTLLNTSHELRNILTHPRVSVEARKKVLSELMTLVTVSPTCQNFVKLLVDRKRATLLTEVVTHYHKLVDVKLGRVRAQVISASALAPAELTELKGALAKSLNKEVIVEESVDANLIGGVITRVDGKVIDGSLRARLQGLGAELRAAR